jgi:transcriptional regulator with XRE-family HTH domain
MTVGERIRSFRESLGLTQQGLADRIGVTVSTVHRWECNKNPPRGAAAKWLRRKGIDLAPEGAPECAPEQAPAEACSTGTEG